MTLSELLGLLKQYGKDAMPGGALNAEVTPQGMLDSAAMATMPVPIVGDLAGLGADAYRYANEPEERTPGNFAMSALGLLPFVPAMSTAKSVPTLLKKTAKGKKPNDDLSPMPELATRYPATAAPVEKFDKASGKPYAGKATSAEAEAVAKRKKAAQAEIDAGNWEPMFDKSKRFHVDASNYPLEGNTLRDSIAKKPDTIAKHKARYDTQETRDRLMAAYDLGKTDPDAVDWYAMGQLEEAFVKELGPEAGRAAFKERFADAMAATTAGQDPESNFLMAAFSNWTKNNGGAFPRNRDGTVASYDLPYPIGGDKVAGNIDAADAVLLQGKPLSAADQPKKHNFSGNFQGHRDKSTIDEQMMGLVDPGGASAPPKGTYGVIEAIVGDLAKGVGVQPENFQDVAWSGAKKMGTGVGQKASPSKPMIERVNESIWRTHKITGLPQEEILRNYIMGRGAMYGMGAGAIGLPFLLGGQPEEM